MFLALQLLLSSYVLLRDTMTSAEILRFSPLCQDITQHMYGFAVSLAESLIYNFVKATLGA
jgi:hypothetical protein